MKYSLRLFTFILLFPVVSYANIAGNMEGDEGENNQAWILHDGLKIPFIAGSELSEGDWIVTSKKGRVKLNLLDGSVIYIGNKSRVKIKAFSMNGKVLKKAFFDIHSGNIRVVPSKNNPKQSNFLITTKTKQVNVGTSAFSMDVKPNYFNPNKDLSSTTGGYTQLNQNAKNLTKTKVLQGNFMIDRPVVQFVASGGHNNLKNLALLNTNIYGLENVKAPSRSMLGTQRTLVRVKKNTLMIKDVLVKAKAAGLQAAKDAQAAQTALANIKAQVSANTISATQAASAIKALNAILLAAKNAGAKASLAISNAQNILATLNSTIQATQNSLASVINAANVASNAVKTAGADVASLLTTVGTDAAAVGGNAASVGTEASTVTSQAQTIAALATGANYVNTDAYYASLVPGVAGFSFITDMKAIYQESVNVATIKAANAQKEYQLALDASLRSKSALDSSKLLVAKLLKDANQAATIAQSANSQLAIEAKNNQLAFTHAQNITANAKLAQAAADLALKNAKTAQAEAALAAVNIQTKVDSLLATTASTSIKNNAVIQARNASASALKKAANVTAVQLIATQAKNSYLAAVSAESLAKSKPNVSALASQASLDAAAAKARLLSAQATLASTTTQVASLNANLLKANTSVSLAIAGKDAAALKLSNHIAGKPSNITLISQNKVKAVWSNQFTAISSQQTGTVASNANNTVVNVLKNQLP